MRPPVLSAVVLVCATAACASTGTDSANDPYAAVTNAPGGGAAPGCESSPATWAETVIDLAPPAGFIEICSKDQQLCGELTSGFPASVRTLGYFFLSGQWAVRQRGERMTPTRYLIAQSSSLTDAEFPGLRTLVRERDGTVPDTATLPKSVDAMDRFNLGVLDDDVDFISSGALVRPRPSSILPSPETHVAITTPFLSRGRVLTLTVSSRFSDRRDIDISKRITSIWITCLRKASK